MCKNRVKNYLECFIMNCTVDSSYAFIIVDTTILTTPHSILILDYSALVERNILYLRFHMNTNYFSKIYSAHYSQEFCITWMLLIYFHILTSCLFKLKSNGSVHAVCLDELFKAEEISQRKITLDYSWNSLQLSECARTFK